MTAPKTPEWHEDERDTDETLAAEERGEVFYDTESFLRALAEGTGIDVDALMRRIDV